MANKNPTVGRLESLIRKLQAERQEHVYAIAAIDESFASLGLDVATPKTKRGRPAKPKAGVRKVRRKKRKGTKKKRSTNGRKKARKKSAQKPKRRGWTAAQKRAQSKMMKKRWAGKKKKKTSAPAKKRRTKRKTKTKRRTKTKQKRKVRQTPALIAARKIQGQYLGCLRKLNSVDKAKVKAVVKKEGVKAALKLANEILKE